MDSVPASLRPHLPQRVSLRWRCGSCPAAVYVRTATGDAASVLHVQCGQCFGTMHLQDVREVDSL